MFHNNISNKIGIFIQARSASSRFPKKIFQPLGPKNQEMPVLLQIYKRLTKTYSGEHVQVVVLVPEDDLELMQWCEAHQIPYFFGSHYDVRDRYRKAAKHYGVDCILRATGDNPCVDSFLAFEALRVFCFTQVDYFTFSNLPLGVGVEIFSTKALMTDFSNEEDYHREHVSVHIKQNPFLFKCLSLKYKSMIDFEDNLKDKPLLNHSNLYASLNTLSKLRLTLDTPQDYEVIQNVFSCLGNDFNLSDVLKLYKWYPEFFLVNQDVEQVQIPSFSYSNLLKRESHLNHFPKVCAS